MALGVSPPFTAVMTLGDGDDQLSNDLETLRAAWPGWRIRHSPTGKWRATRTGPPLTWQQMAVNMAETLHADDAEDLTAQLKAQQQAESKFAGDES